MAQTVIGIFESLSKAQNAKEYLLDNGFSNDQVDISTSSTTGNGSDTTTATSYTGSTETTNTVNDEHESGIGHFFRTLFGDDEEDTHRYSEAGRRGTIVTVHAHTPEQAESASDILDDHGAVDVNEFAAGTSSASTHTEGLKDTLTSDITPSSDHSPLLGKDEFRNENTANTDTFKVIEENLNVGKREVETGGIKVRSRIVERFVDEHIRLKKEHVSIERTPVNRPATEADFAAFKEGEIEMTEHAEVPVVSKEARVVEEISLNKNIEEEEANIREKVRKTEVDTENLKEGNNIAGNLHTDRSSGEHTDPFKEGDIR